MKKIAFFQRAFTDPTMPLVKRFLDNGYQVDMYFDCGKSFEPAFAFTNKTVDAPKGIHEIPKDAYCEILPYLNSNNFHANTVRITRPLKSIPLLRIVCGAIRKFDMYRVMKKITQQQYDLLYLIALYNNSEYVDYLKSYKGKYICGLHEVSNHSHPNYLHIPALIEFLIKKHIPIVVYSRNSKVELLKYKGINPEMVYETRFGVYETFPFFAKEDLEGLPQKYFLFFGYFAPYKGLNIFVEASKLFLLKHPEYKVVIAGHGDTTLLESIKNDERFVKIIKFLSNSELASLIKNCTAVVCPYITASQSGITQTAYAFNKPIIASRLPSFEDSIIDRKTGILTEVGSPDSVAKAMEQLASENFSDISCNLEKTDGKLAVYKWNSIYEFYVKAFLKDEESIK